MSWNDSESIADCPACLVLWDEYLLTGRGIVGVDFETYVRPPNEITTRWADFIRFLLTEGRQQVPVPPDWNLGAKSVPFSVRPQDPR